MKPDIFWLLSTNELVDFEYRCRYIICVSGKPSDRLAVTLAALQKEIKKRGGTPDTSPIHFNQFNQNSIEAAKRRWAAIKEDASA